MSPRPFERSGFTIVSRRTVNTRLSDVTDAAWQILAKLQVITLSDNVGVPPQQRSMFWVGQLEGILVEILDAIHEEETSGNRPSHAAVY
jgi:hypothetical protein